MATPVQHLTWHYCAHHVPWFSVPALQYKQQLTMLTIDVEACNL